MVQATGFFQRDGDAFAPTGLGVSPWNGNSQSGVSVAALIAHLVDGVPTPAPMQVARLTIDLMGAVPMTPLRPQIRVLREGKRVQLIEIALLADGRSWVRATALRVRVADTPAVNTPLPAPFPIGAATASRAWLELIDHEGPLDGARPGPRWVRFLGGAIVGQPPSPLQRMAMLADFGAGIAAPLPRQEWTLANLDIAVHLARPARGEWLLIDSTSETAGNGVGLIHNRFGDVEGMIGGGHQTIFLDRWHHPHPFPGA